jgi:hypothetical protein
VRMLVSVFPRFQHSDSGAHSVDVEDVRGASMNRNVRILGWEIPHAAVSRRPPISLHMIVPRTEGCTCAAKVWELSRYKDHFLAPRANLPDPWMPLDASRVISCPT